VLIIRFEFAANAFTVRGQVFGRGNVTTCHGKHLSGRPRCSRDVDAREERKKASAPERQLELPALPGRRKHGLEARAVVAEADRRVRADEGGRRPSGFALANRSASAVWISRGFGG